MTETEWLEGGDPRPMFSLVERLAPARRLLLFCVQCCFRNRGETNPDDSTGPFAELWRLTERYADGRADASEVRTAWAAAELDPDYDDPELPFRPAGWAWNWAHRADELSYDLSDAAISRLLRDIFGNPFRPVALDSAWRTSDVLALARGIYDERAFDRLPILADALQDAECDSADLLNHLRELGEHVRGCWALDLVLGKE